MFESLENRTMFNVGAGGGNFKPGQFGPAEIVQSGSTLTITNAHDLSAFETTPGTVEVYDRSVGGQVVEPQTYTGVTTLVITGTNGGDMINTGLDYVNATIAGGQGHDQIIIADNITDGTGGSTVVYGGSGNDTLIVSKTAFNSGTKVFGERGRDTYDGPAGVLQD